LSFRVEGTQQGTRNRLQLSRDQCRALALLAASPEGLTESLLVYAHKVPFEVRVEVTDAGREAISALQC
jgi:hypothetical protein